MAARALATRARQKWPGQVDRVALGGAPELEAAWAATVPCHRDLYGALAMHHCADTTRVRSLPTVGRDVSKGQTAPGPTAPQALRTLVHLRAEEARHAKAAALRRNRVGCLPPPPAAVCPLCVHGGSTSLRPAAG